MKSIILKAALVMSFALVGKVSAGINIASGATVTVNGTLSTDSVTAGSGGVLRGNGTVSAGLTINPGGIIAPGTSPGTLGLTNAAINGTYQCELDGANADRIAATGTLDLTNATIDFITLSAPTGSSYIIASYQTLNGANSAVVNNIPTNYEIDYNFDNGIDSNNIALVLSPFSVWATARGLQPGVNSAPGDDPNSDGLPNFFHYSFDTDPLGDANAPKKIRHQIAEVGGQDYLVITVPIRKGATFSGSPLTSNAIDGVIYIINGDAGLTAPWNLPVIELTPALSAGLPALGSYDGIAGEDWEYRSFRLTNPVDALSAAFIRAGVSTTP